MAIIKSMHLKGFKSFAKQLDLQFGPEFNCVIGPNGSGKSVSPNTQILLSSGKTIKIGELVDKKLKESKNIIHMDDGIFTLNNKDEKIFSLNPKTMTIVEKKIDAFIRREGEPHLYEIKTKTGKKVTTTGCHPIMIFKNGKIISELVENLNTKDKIATPRKLKIKEKPTTLPKLKGIKESKNFYYFPNKRGIGKINKTISKNTARLFGYIIGDGSINKSNYVQLTNMDKELLEDYKKIAKENNFPISLRKHNKAYNSYIYSSKFADFLINIFKNNYTKEKKHIPEQFMMGNKENLSSLLSALFDCDATVDKNKPTIEYSTMSEKLCNQVQTALLRFNIVGRKKVKIKYASNTKEKRRKPYYYINIDGKINLNEFKNEIGFLCKHKKERLVKHTKNKIPNQNLDVLPKETNQIIKKCINNLGIAYKPQRKNYPNLAAYIENRCSPTREGLEKVLPLFYNKFRILHELSQELQFEQRALCEAMYVTGCSSTEVANAIGITRHTLVDTWYPEMFQAKQENIQKFHNFMKQEIAYRLKKSEHYLQILENLARSDIYWDEIIEINKVKGEKYVYDLSIPDHHNFIANNVIVHNSNIMDGLCFVLGKLSAKSMRAEKSSNLIFNGGKKGSALKEAEVSIVFTNKEKEFPIESEEVKITRVIKNTGNSVYKINDQVLTRQQILELLAAAKIDPDGHNIILQGDIVRFMEMRAENRRELIEDIAGISIFEDKKAKAMTSLAKVDSHLNDATIILKEREAYLRELKKDKDQAEKYKSLEGNIKSNKATYLHIQIKEKETKLEETELKIKKQEEIINSLDQKTKEIREKIELKKQELKNINSDIEEKGEKDAIILQDDIEKLKTNLATNSERLSTCKNELSKITDRKKQLLSSIEDTKKTIKDLEESKINLTKEIQLLKEKESKQSIAINQLKGKLGITTNIELEKIESILDEKIKAYEKLQEKNQELLQKKFKLDADISSLNEKILSVEKLEKTSNTQQLRKDLEKISKELEKNLNEDTFLFTQLKKAREDYSQANEELFKLQTQESSMKASAEADMAIRKIKSLRNPNIYGTVSELGKVDKKFATALEVAAGPRTESLVVKDDKIAAECIQTLKTSKVGIATFLPINKIKSKPITRVKGNGIYGNAVDLIDFDPRFKDIFTYVFGNTIVVENIETARRIGIGKSRMVTLDGDLIEVSGAMVGGYRTRRIGLGFQEKSVSSNLNKLTEQIDKLSKVKSLLERKKLENENKITEERDIKSRVEAELIKYERTSSGISLTELIKQRNSLKSDQIYTEFSEIGKVMGNLNSELQKLKSERQKIKGTSTTEKGTDELETHESRRLKTREEIVERNTQIKNIEIQIKNIYIPEQEKIQQLIKNSDKELEDFNSEARTLSDLLKNQQSTLSNKEAEKSKFQKAYKDLFNSRNKMSEIVQKLESSILLEAEKEKAIRDKINDYSIIKAKVKAEIEALESEFEEFKGTTLRRGLSVEQLKLEIKNFEQMLSKIGNVNMRALEVYEEIHKEYEKLIEKRDKLIQEKEDVLKMIEEIETNKKSIFMKTYKELNKNFSRIFLALSRKGEASLELEDKENPLLGGVDIRVRIAGNKYLDIKSLSGGEKTMAALAFIFAIQEYQPMAFYLLDEVDAALDKKNSELLAELVAKYSKTAQYIMISHNDNVITEADYVYGVSMHETGISKVVSLKL